MSLIVGATISRPNGSLYWEYFVAIPPSKPIDFDTSLCRGVHKGFFLRRSSCEAGDEV
ncbi:MAG: hypothetical protein II225_05400 [Ruminococcus sp.]|nr:hypothetical protein [Ruminococcus sp.]